MNESQAPAVGSWRSVQIVVGSLGLAYSFAMLGRNLYELRGYPPFPVGPMRELLAHPLVCVLWCCLLLTSGGLLLVAGRGRRGLGWALAVLVAAGPIGFESEAWHEARQFARMIVSVRNALEAATEIIKHHLNTDGTVPPNLPKGLPEEMLVDGWGHPLVYFKRSPRHAIIVAPGADGRVEREWEFDGYMRHYPVAEFAHDIVVMIGPDIHGTSPPGLLLAESAQPSNAGEPCEIYSAVRCLAWWR